MGLMHIYCGDGKGKTTAATGLTLRALGCGKKVLFVQFFKSGNSSEIKLLKTLENLDYMKADKNFGFFFKMNDEEKVMAKEYFTQLFAKAISMANNYDMIVFDEIISTYNHNCLDKEELKKFCANKENIPEIIFTGRNPADELIEMADYVSEVKKIKHPYEKGISARLGIEF